MRMLALAVSAGLLSCASFAQTPATPMLTTATPLTANSGDQNIKLSKARGPFKKGAVIKLCPVTSVTPASSYVAKASACPVPAVTPPVLDPTPQPAAPVLTLSAGNAFGRIGDTVWGFNPYGGMGSMVVAPAAFRVPGEKLATKGWFSAGVELIGINATVDNRAVSYTMGGKRYAFGNAWYNLAGTGSQGTWSEDGTWTGQLGCIRLDHRVTLAADRVASADRLTNTCAQPLTDVRVLVAQDPNDGDTGTKQVTFNRIVSAASMTAMLSSGRTFSLNTDDPRFVAALSTNVASINGKSGYIWANPDNVKPQAVGFGNRENNALILTGRVGDLAVNASTSWSYVSGIK